MARKRELVMTITGPQGGGKTAIIDKFCAYLDFFDIETTQIDEHTVKLQFNEEAIRRLQEAK